MLYLLNPLIRLHKKNLQDQFIKLVDSHCNKTGKSTLLKEIIENRKTTILNQLHGSNIGNLADIFSTQTAKNIIGKQASPILPEDYFLIEKIAHRLFGCLLSFWTELEIFRTIQNSMAINQPPLNTPDKTYTSKKINDDYHYEIVTDIALDKRVFYTDFCEQPLLLSDAIVLINIATFIKQHKWYEMLSILDISSKGEHFILYQFDNDNPYPTIISSALIEPYHDKVNWLFFDNFFQSDKWEKTQNIHKVAQLFPNMTSLSTQQDQTLEQLTCSELENEIFSSIVEKSTVCGVIRFTVNGAKPKMNYHMYLAQKGLAMALFHSKRTLIFSIIEQPAMVLFYQSMACIENDDVPFVFTGNQDINQSGLVTHKGICFTKNASSAFNRYNFREYNAKIIEKRRELKQR